MKLIFQFFLSVFLNKQLHLFFFLCLTIYFLFLLLIIIIFSFFPSLILYGSIRNKYIYIYKTDLHLSGSNTSGVYTSCYLRCTAPEIADEEQPKSYCDATGSDAMQNFSLK